MCTTLARISQSIDLKSLFSSAEERNCRDLIRSNGLFAGSFIWSHPLVPHVVEARSRRSRQGASRRPLPRPRPTVSECRIEGTIRATFSVSPLQMIDVTTSLQPRFAFEIFFRRCIVLRYAANCVVLESPGNSCRLGELSRQTDLCIGIGTASRTFSGGCNGTREHPAQVHSFMAFAEGLHQLNRRPTRDQVPWQSRAEEQP